MQFLKLFFALLVAFLIKPLLEQAFLNDLRERVESITILTNMHIVDIFEALLLAGTCLGIFRLMEGKKH